MEKSHHWRHFAPQFIAKDEVRYEDFELSERLQQRGSLPTRARDARVGGGESGEETAEANEISLERRRKEMDRQRERWKKREADREREMRQSWETHLAEQRVKKETERVKQKAILAELAIASRKAKRREELRLKRATQSQDESVFLTSIDEDEDDEVSRDKSIATWNRAIVRDKAPELEPYVGKIKVPQASEEFTRSVKKAPSKPGLPDAARGQRKTNASSGGKDKGEKSGKNFREHFDTMLEKAEQIVAEEEARKAEAANITSDDTDPEKSLMPNKNQLRRAQLKIMRQLASSMGAYRKQCATQFQRIVELSEMSYGDKEKMRIAQKEGWSGVPKAVPTGVLPSSF
jgi:hypothetical protein